MLTAVLAIVAVASPEHDWRDADRHYALAQVEYAARQDVPDLLAEVERLRAMVDNVVGQTAGTLMRAQDAERRIAERQGGHEWRRH